MYNGGDYSIRIIKGGTKYNFCMKYYYMAAVTFSIMIIHSVKAH